MDSMDAVHVSLAAATGEVDCGELLAAMQAEGWQVHVANDVHDMVARASSGNCHLAVALCPDPSALPEESVRVLTGLQTDLAVVYLVPHRDATRQCPALAWATSNQIRPLRAPVADLMEAFREELAAVSRESAAYTVFCVDDDEGFLASLNAFLPGRLRTALPRFDLGFELFARPGEALAEAADLPGEQLAVVISDQIMPEMSGTDLLGHIKHLSPNTSCVLLTGCASLDSAIAAINQRTLDRYFLKPVADPTDFARSIEHLLCEHHLRLRSAAYRRRVIDQFELVRMLAGASSEKAVLTISANLLRQRLATRRVTGLLRASQGYVVHVSLGAEERKSRSEDVLDDPEWLSLAAAGQLVLWGKEDRPPEGAPPAALLPLIHGRRPIGLLFVADRDGGRPFARDERTFMSFVADVTAMALEGWRDRRVLEDHYVGIIATLAETVEAKDSYTHGHTKRVGELAMALAEAVHVTGEQATDIRRAAELHDIGKIAVPDAIILKPTPLDPDEYRIIMEHSVRADRILGPLKFLNAARMIIRAHHERYDGTGYPDGLAGEEIPLGARILAIADAYDAMTSTRAYRQAMDHRDAVREIEAGAGRQFDPKLVLAFVRMMRQRLSSDSTQAASISSRLLEEGEA